MDPNSTLALFWCRYDASEYLEAFESGNALIEWLVKGGFQPKWATSSGMGELSFYSAMATVRDHLGLTIGDKLEVLEATR